VSPHPVPNLVEIRRVKSDKALKAGGEMSQNGEGKIIVLFDSVKEIKMKNRKSLT